MAMNMTMVMVMVMVVFMWGIQRRQKGVIFDRKRQKTFQYVCKITNSAFCSKWVDLENLETML
jgi:hypothetical protein